MPLKLDHQVVGEGPLGGLCIVGESPGAVEQQQGKPFVGPSGQLLRRYAASVGLEGIRFEYTVERELPSNDFGSLYRDKQRSLPGEELQAWRTDLRERLKLIKPKLIIAAGAEALKALTDYNSISDVHCYVLEPWELPCKVIPIHSPSSVLKLPANAFWLKYGLAKAKEVLEGAFDPDFNLYTSNTKAEVESFLSKALKAPEVCIDIETIKGKAELTAIGLSYDANNALSITKSCPEWDSVIWVVTKILADESVLKIGQNFIFDLMVLWKLYGIEPRGLIWDTMHCANVLYSDLRKSLAELGRFYLYRAPWKGSWNSTGEKLRVYNAQDVISTHRIYQKQKADLEKSKLLDYFTSATQPMWLPAFKLATRGIRVDVEAKASMAEAVDAALAPLRADVVRWAADKVPPAEKKSKKRDNVCDVLIVDGLLSTIPEKERKLYYVAKKKDQKFGKTIGLCYRKAFREEITLVKRAFNPKSPSQTERVLVNAGVKIPKVKAGKEWKESTNEKALKKILERSKDSGEVREFVRNLLVLRHGEKLISSYCKATLDTDNRWRCSYNPEGTETGRSSTQKTPWETGGNNQNIPRGGFQGIQFKKVFIPDEGKIFIQADQSQAEARVVAALSGCKKMLELFAAGADIHEYAASSLLDVDMDNLKLSNPPKYKLYRQYAKIVNHGGNYDMGAFTLSENAMKDGIDLKVDEAQRFLQKRREIFPEIYEWHKQLENELKRTRTLWTPFGRRRAWLGKIEPAMMREAYAHKPQSVVPHITNLMWRWVEGSDYEVLQMGHDSLLIQGKESALDAFCGGFAAQAQRITFKCGEVENFNIPWDIQVGTNWSNMVKWERSTERGTP